MENKDYQRKWYLKNKEKQIEKTKRHKKKIRDWFMELKATMCCSTCGENHIACLEFHHLDPTKKEELVSKLIAYSGSKKRIMKEVEKCIVLCANCHRKETIKPY